MDKISRELRSMVMSRVHGTGTKPELYIRRGLFSHGYRFRVNSAGLPGRPDIKLTKYSAVIFIHGCFWHGHNCGLFRPSSSNVGYWGPKLKRNRERDLEDLDALRNLGWRVCVVWECAIKLAAAGKDKGVLMDGIAAWLEGSGSFMEFSGAGSAIRRSRSTAAYVAERTAAYGSCRK
jgi:DNA mismatch endonuclease (patch repair protein)